MNKQQEAHALLSMYEKLFYEKVGSPAIINRFRDKWGMMEIIESIGYHDSKRALTYYFGTEGPYTLRNFYMKADLLLQAAVESEKDAELRRELRRKTRELVEEA